MTRQRFAASFRDPSGFLFWHGNELYRHVSERYRDTRLTKLGRVYIDGVPLDLASQLLPRRTWLRPGLLFHLHSHARSQRRFADRPDPTVSQRKIGQTGLLALIDNLRSTINRLAAPRDAGHWASYYEDNSYSSDAERTKRETVTRWLQKLAPAQAFDLGANTGEFSRLAADQGIATVSMDFDEGCVEQNFQQYTAKGNNLVLPLVHHLAIAHNVPWDLIVSFFAETGRNLIVEFVPKGDPQVNRLLASREDIFDTYTVEHFESAFQSHFEIVDRVEIPDTKRRLFLMRRTDGTG